MDIAYFRNNQLLLKTGDKSHCLHVIIKGLVEERSENGNEIFTHYIHDDIFDILALFSDKIRHDYISLEDILVYLSSRSTFIDLRSGPQ